MTRTQQIVLALVAILAVVGTWAGFTARTWGKSAHAYAGAAFQASKVAASGVEQEIADREAADKALDGKVTVLAGRVTKTEGRLDKVEGQVGSIRRTLFAKAREATETKPATKGGLLARIEALETACDNGGTN